MGFDATGPELIVRQARMAGRLTAPPSKSITHRALLLAALAEGDCRVIDPLWSADTRATLAALRQLGAEAEEEADGCVTFAAWALAPAGFPIDCANAGTTLRLITAQAARLPATTVIRGDRSLSGRPNAALLGALRQLGARVDAPEGRAPIMVRGPMLGGRAELDASLSSQFVTALLLAAPFLEDPTELVVSSLASAPYVRMTERMLADFGVVVERTARGWRIAGQQRANRPHYRVAGDWSAAAFSLVAAAITGGSVRVDGLRDDDLQGDAVLVELLGRFGISLAWDSASLELTPAPLRAAGSIDVGDCPDLFPPLAALAACCPGTTRLHGSPGLRHKESDRVRAMAALLGGFGVASEALDDGLVVHGGGRLTGHSAHSFEDHRVHMAAAVLGLVAAGETRVDAPDCVAVSYPHFHRDLGALLTPR
jgi:3-phosphoshikimate 1-carboxyvinyltransferase